jgi:hypothetical protein
MTTSGILVRAKKNVFSSVSPEAVVGNNERHIPSATLRPECTAAPKRR